jgi:hypothetical protein
MGLKGLEGLCVLTSVGRVCSALNYKFIFKAVYNSIREV